MRKEILIATIAGIMIGILVAFGSWRANLALKVKDEPNVSKTEGVSPNSKAKPTGNQAHDELVINLSNIEDFDVLTDQKLNITGITKPNSLVAISSESNDYIIKSSANGSFQQEVDLVPGPNQILLSAVSVNGNSVNKKLTVVYSAEFGSQTNN